MERSRLSSWRAMLSKFQNKKNKLVKQVSQLTKDITSLTKKIKDLEVKIDKLNNQDIIICDHAKERYRERFNPIATDEEIYEDLVTEELKYLTSTLGNGQYPVNDKLVIIKDKIIITTF